MQPRAGQGRYSRLHSSGAERRRRVLQGSETAAPAARLAAGSRRRGQLARERDRDPVPDHLPARRAPFQPRHLGPRGRGAAGDRPGREPARGASRRPRGRSHDVDGLAGTAGRGLRVLPVRAPALARVRARPGRRRRERGLRAQPFEPARVADLARAAHRRLRPHARDRQPRVRHRRPRRRPDRDHAGARELRRALRGGRGHLPRLHGPAAVRAGPAARPCRGPVARPLLGGPAATGPSSGCSR